MSTKLSDTTLDRERVAVSTVWSAGLMASLTVVVANVAIWIVLVPLAGLDLKVPSKFGSTELQDLPLATVVFVSAVAALAGVVLLWLLTRAGQRGVTWWSAAAVIFGIASIGSPLSLDVSIGQKLGLVAFHLAATAVIVSVARNRLSKSSP
ncbi:MAG: DUF6069 family protein [Actinomycetota bacterium]|nr:DUF6069 family protein [Actinomycetota bacterium]